ncbi:hypothetical protein IQ218_03985 [Synechocystis salina LEGE 06099]|uniref:DUF7305 domain-containing protein n=1 Tax=Synechocystis salina TaxID=945780 RepID=UPI001882D767|nr:hypothetical protein [Synechocystis salina]MBE9202778.1 hypothetical protein [Synechocystis salina LEGE 06099]
MNTRFFLNFLTASKRNAGFAMPMVIMGGLVITVAAAAIAMKGMNDQNQVTSKAMKQQSEAIAEAGAAQYTDFLNNHPKLAIANHVDWPTAWNNHYSGSTGSIGSSSSSSSASGAQIPQALVGGQACQTTDYDSTGNPTNSGGGTSNISSSEATNWVTPGNVRSIASGKGKVSLVGYAYDGLKNVGSIAVQGIVGEDGGNQSVSQIQYAFMVRPEQVLNTPIIPQIGTGGPGLWARSFDTAAIAYANVLDSSGCGSGTTAFGASAGNLPAVPLGPLPNGNHTPTLSSNAATITQKDIPFPPLPNYPSTSQFATLVSQNKVNQLSSCSRTQYPAAGDHDSNGNAYSSSTTTPQIYKYRITGNCALQNNTQFGTTGKGNETIIMYVDSGFTASNNGRLSSDGNGAAKVHWHLLNSDLTLRGNAQVGSSSPSGGTAKNWAFFLHNGTSVDLRGTADHYAFIFAPNATADMRGNPKIGGALWVNRFETNGAPPKVFQALNQQDFNEIFTTAYNASGETSYASQTVPAKIELVGNYTTQEVGTPVTIPAGLNYATAYASSAASSISSQASSTVSSTTSSASSMASSAQSSVSSALPLSSITDRVTCIAAGGNWNNGQGGRCR